MTSKSFSLFATIAFSAAACLGASFSTYSQAITTSTSSLTITEATHGIASRYLAVSVKDGTGAVLAPSLYSYSVNSSTYEVDITFSPSLSSGTVYIFGGFASDTSASTDFQVTGAGTGSLTVCQYCTTSVPAQRTDAGGKGWVLAEPVVFTIQSQTDSMNAKVYLNPSTNHVILGYGNAAHGTITCTPTAYCAVVTGITAFPSGSIPLGNSLSNNSALWGTITDDRPTQFQ